MTERDSLQDVYQYIDDHADEYIASLQRMLRQPSIAAQGLGMTEMAAMVEEDLAKLGFDPRQIDTRGGYPVVYGEKKGASDKTLSFYNHYDVQPADPLNEWTSDPWAAEIRDGKIFARGVSDNKGNIAARFAAIHAWEQVNGELPLNLKFIIEGEEEVGSMHLQNFIDDNRELCQADACIWEFGGRDIDGRPQIHLGLKGICYVELRATGARTDWHSSMATSVPNPAWRLVWALSTLKGEDDRVLIPGLYDKVVDPTDAEMEAMKNLPNIERERLEDLDAVALHAEHLAADVRRGVRAEERDQRGHVLRGEEVELAALEGRVALVPVLLRHEVEGHGGERGGGDRVGRDPAARALHGDDRGERGDAGLGGAVVALAEVAQQTRRRRRVDDVARLALGLPVLHRRAGGQEVPAQVHADDGVPVVVGHLGQRLVPQDAGVVDQRVEPAELAHGGLDEPVRDVGIGDVARDGDRAPPRGGDLVGHRLAGGRVELGDHDRRALCGALQRLAPADAATRTGDDHDLAVQKSHPGSI